MCPLLLVAWIPEAQGSSPAHSSQLTTQVVQLETSLSNNPTPGLDRLVAIAEGLKEIGSWPSGLGVNAGNRPHLLHLLTLFAESIARLSGGRYAVELQRTASADPAVIEYLDRLGELVSEIKRLFEPKLQRGNPTAAKAEAISLLDRLPEDARGARTLAENACRAEERRLQQAMLDGLAIGVRAQYGKPSEETFLRDLLPETIDIVPGSGQQPPTGLVREIVERLSELATRQDEAARLPLGIYGSPKLTELIEWLEGLGVESSWTVGARSERLVRRLRHVSATIQLLGQMTSVKTLNSLLDLYATLTEARQEAGADIQSLNVRARKLDKRIGKQICDGLICHYVAVSSPRLERSVPLDSLAEIAARAPDFLPLVLAEPHATHKDLAAKGLAGGAKASLRRINHARSRQRRAIVKQRRLDRL